MIIRRIKLKNFKIFEKSDHFIDQTTFIKGKNGSGKTTLALESLLFCLYGFTTKEKLSDLPTRSKSKSCTVGVEIWHNNKEYRVIRDYPTKLTIYENNKEITFTNNMERQNFINETFGDRLHFMKFRLIDAYTKETNFLEEGQTALKNIIFSGSDEVINNMRLKLNSIKHEREIYNKDKAMVYPYYPSEKRLQLISNKYKELNNQENDILHTLREFQSDQNKIEREMGKLEADKIGYDKKKEKLSKDKKCYTCNQPISVSNQKQLLTETEQSIEKITQQLQENTIELGNTKDIIVSHIKVQETISTQLKKVSELKLKLENRIKQKDYKYTDKDVAIVKKAISELDRLSTYYLTESIRILEPIINSVLDKIGFFVSFKISDNNKFSIILQKDGIEYKYKDLSTGEKLIFQIAFKLALLLERGNEGIIIADEGFSSLDSENLFHILSIFNNLPFQLIFVIHNLDEIPESIKVINLDKEEKDV